MSDDTDNISDGYHTFGELYEYRMLYNAGFFNELALNPDEFGMSNPLFGVHKSWRHSDGEPPFGKPLGKMFIVVAQLPTGQISNHYDGEHWDLFQIPERELSAEYDGHTPAMVAERLTKYLKGDY